MTEIGKSGAYGSTNIISEAKKVGYCSRKCSDKDLTMSTAISVSLIEETGRIAVEVNKCQESNHLM